MAKNLTFDMVVPEDIDYLRECRNKKELWETLSSIFIAQLETWLLHKHPEDKKQGLREVFLDFMTLVSTRYLAILNEPEKLSVALQVTFETFARSFGSHMPKKESLALMSSLVNRHAGADPPMRYLVFTIEDVKGVSEVLVDTFFAAYELYYDLFATVLVSHFSWGPVNFGRFPHLLPLDYGLKVPSPVEEPGLKQLYFSVAGDDELDELELKELMQGSLQ
jgi:hypothetical protein